MKKDFTLFQDPVFKTLNLGSDFNLPLDEIKKKVDALNLKAAK